MNGKILGFICPPSRNLFGENLYSLFAFEEFCFVNWLLSFGYVVVLRVKSRDFIARLQYVGGN